MKYVKWLNEVTIDDLPLVGGKNASLGEMTQELSAQGINVARGFAITSNAYWRYLDYNGLREKIKRELDGLDTQKTSLLREKTKYVRDLITFGKMPDDLTEEITAAYKQLCERYGDDTAVAVRSSATAEDMPDASFAGQQETFLNIVGEQDLLIAVKKCIASLFTNRAISYREDKGFDHFKIALSVGVQKMVRSDLASSGVMFTIDTESGFKNAVLINSIYGLGENIVQGKVSPDEFYYFKPTKQIISKKIGPKRIKMIYSNDHKNPVKDAPVSKNEQQESSITDKEVLQLGQWGVEIEEHYEKAMDIEWAKDGRDKKLYIVQARPETVQSQRDYNIVEEYKLSKKGKIVSSGKSVGAKIGAGIANTIMDVKDIHKFKKGEVLVTDMTDPDWEPIMKIASAIVTDRGGRTCHAAIVSRELGIPCIVGTEDVSKKVKAGDKITVSCAEGEEGFVYDGILKYKIKKTNIKKDRKSVV